MQIVSISRNRWDGQWMNRQHLMWAMKDLVRVLHVEDPLPLHRGLERSGTGLLRPVVEDPAPNLRVLRLPRLLAFRSQDGVWNRFASGVKARMIRRHLRSEAGPPVIYTWLPQMAPYFGAFPREVKAYHMFDLTEGYVHTPHLAAYLAGTTAKADLCFGATPQQVAALPVDKSTLVRNAAQLEWYDAVTDEPAPLADVPRPRVGYMGKISTKLDFDWFEALADEGTWQLVLIGPVQLNDPDYERRWKALIDRPTVHYLGFQAARDVPSYVKGLDLGLVCYQRGLWCEAASPLKLYEYSAAGIPTVGSRIESLTTDEAASSIVRFADTPADAVEAVRTGLADAAGNAELHARIRTFAESNSWRARAELVHRKLVEAADRSPRRTAAE